MLKRSALFSAKLEVKYENMGMDGRSMTKDLKEGHETTNKVRWQNYNYSYTIVVCLEPRVYTCNRIQVCSVPCRNYLE